MDIRRFVKLIRKDEGSGLILALMTLMVLSVLGASLGMITIGSYKLGDVNRDDNSAYYIAEAGANMAYDEIKKGVQTAYNKDSITTEISFFNDIEGNEESIIKSINGKEYNDFTTQFGEHPKATVTIKITVNDESTDYKIISVGEVGQHNRTVEKNITVTWISKSNTGPGYGALPTTTTIARDELIVHGGVEVSGSVYLDSSTGILNIDDNFDNKDLDNLTVYVHTDIYDREKEKYKDNEVIIKERSQTFDWKVYTDLVDEFPSFPENPDFTEWPSAFDNTDGNISFDTTGGNISIVLESLTIKKNINIIGDGRVDIYVRNNLEIEQNVRINESINTDADQLQIFYGDPESELSSSAFTTKNSIYFKGTLFAKNANIDFGNNAELDGLIISGSKGDEPEVNLGKGDLNTLIIAPYAKVKLDTSSNNNAVKGIIVGRKVELVQNMSIVFSNEYLENFPLTLPDPDSDGSGGGELIITEPGIEN